MENKNKGTVTLMIQGTASDVGKSIITTALCRIFAREGQRVAPFKSWNMSLNSYVTSGGGEIGIAQALQAEAAGIEPHVDMQPLLVKPRGDGKSQIIARGRPLGDLAYKEQQGDYICRALEIIEGSLNNLKRDYDVIVMEGAGSPAEINREGRDLANMMVAELNKTPVILVADIDRGGAFASLVGTMQLLKPRYKKLVKGFIINRFRGDYSLLKPGIEFLENKTGKSVFGVLPHFKDIELPEEDSASLNSRKKTGREDITIAVINLPRMSNFTDFQSLAREPDVAVHYINSCKELTEPEPDLIIIPGTKSTTSDLKYLHTTGLAGKIKEYRNLQIPIIGICGGYQMMGKQMLDDHGTEGDITAIKGLNILPIVTRFLPEKTTHQVNAEITGEGFFFRGLNGERITGYEIHMGETRYLQGNTDFPFKIRSRSGSKVEVRDGAVGPTGLCFGTYLHGLFNNDSLRRSLLNKLREKKGLAPINRSGYSYVSGMKADYDKLADRVRQNLDLESIFRLLNFRHF